MRKLLVILLSVELLVSILLSQVGVLHRRDFDTAFIAWHKNPTAENRLELDRQKYINELYHWGFSAVFFGGMAVVALLAVYACKRRQRSESTIQVERNNSAPP